MEFAYQHQHQAEALLITCIDFRFHQATVNFVKGNLVKDFDLLTMPGAAKNFVSGNILSQETVKIVKDICLPLHHIKKIIVINHSDCGAYGGSKNFASAALEERQHQEDLKQAKEILIRAFPHLEIIIGYVKVTEKQLDFLIF